MYVLLTFVHSFIRSSHFRWKRTKSTKEGRKGREHCDSSMDWLTDWLTWMVMCYVVVVVNRIGFSFSTTHFDSFFYSLFQYHLCTYLLTYLPPSISIQSINPPPNPTHTMYVLYCTYVLYVCMQTIPMLCMVCTMHCTLACQFFLLGYIYLNG